ncbi:MAG: hypothetical protein V4704_01900 [Pseudomonadota bacterium]
MPLRPFVLTLIIATVAACTSPTSRQQVDPARASAVPLFETFGDLHRDIGSPVAAAQRYFDQGLRMSYGFNHEAAGRAFAEAARLDPACAMCTWGQAMVLGPNINLPMDPALAKRANELSKRAAALSASARPADRGLIMAQLLRFRDPAPKDRTPLDRAYADALGRLAAEFPLDDDVATLHAEALMNLSPWAYWTADGKPTQFTGDILAALERVLARNPRHIGAMHYYIHATEASRTPERALAAADALAALAPGSGHLVHMPAHTYIRMGRYHDATLTNFAATTADAAFLSFCRGSNGVYPVGYVPHNWHFATMTTGLTGSRVLSLQAARQTASRVDRAVMGTPEMAFMQAFLVAPLFTQVRFGDWEAILASAAPPADLPFPTAIWRFARGMAHVRSGALAAAARDVDALHAIAIQPDMQKLQLGPSTYGNAVLRVADALLRGELLRASGKRADALAALRRAVAAEDALPYNEPADWPLPTRHYLGAALLEAGAAKDARQAFLHDLERYPDNGWSLFGLAEAERLLGDAEAARDAEQRLALAWQWADAPLTAARY